MEYTIRKEIHNYIFNLLFYHIPAEGADLDTGECNDIADDIINMIEDKYNVTEK